MLSKFKTIGLLTLALALVFTMGISPADAAKDGKKNETVIPLTKEEVQQFERVNGATPDENTVGGMIVLPKELSKEQVKAYKEKMLKPQKKQKAKDDDVNALWCSGYYLSNVQYQGNTWYFPSQRLGSSEGWGPLNLSLTVNRSVSATFSANVNVSAEVVSAGVGYSVTASYGVSSSGSWNVPAGRYGRLEGYALHDKHTWDVWDDTCFSGQVYRGSGESFKPNGGVFFKQVIVQ